MDEESLKPNTTTTTTNNNSSSSSGSSQVKTEKESVGGMSEKSLVNEGQHKEEVVATMMQDNSNNNNNNKVGCGTNNISPEAATTTTPSPTTTNNQPNNNNNNNLNVASTSSSCSSILTTTMAAASGLPLQQRPQQQPLINLQINTTTGGNFGVTVDAQINVETLKKLISKKLKVVKDRICLLHRERELQDGTLNENNLMDGSKIILIPNVETGLMAQRPENTVMQALESLNDSQVNDFLSGKTPLNLSMRLGDHMMLIQLQLSTVHPIGYGSSMNSSTSHNHPHHLCAYQRRSSLRPTAQRLLTEQNRDENRPTACRQQQQQQQQPQQQWQLQQVLPIPILPNNKPTNVANSNEKPVPIPNSSIVKPVNAEQAIPIDNKSGNVEPSVSNIAAATTTSIARIMGTLKTEVDTNAKPLGCTRTADLTNSNKPRKIVCITTKRSASPPHIPFKKADLSAFFDKQDVQSLQSIVKNLNTRTKENVNNTTTDLEQSPIKSLSNLVSSSMKTTATKPTLIKSIPVAAVSIPHPESVFGNASKGHIIPCQDPITSRLTSCLCKQRLNAIKNTLIQNLTNNTDNNDYNKPLNIVLANNNNGAKSDSNNQTSKINNNSASNNATPIVDNNNTDTPIENAMGNNNNDATPVVPNNNNNHEAKNSIDNGVDSTMFNKMSSSNNNNVTPINNNSSLRQCLEAKNVQMRPQGNVAIAPPAPPAGLLSICTHLTRERYISRSIMMPTNNGATTPATTNGNLTPATTIATNGSNDLLHRTANNPIQRAKQQHRLLNHRYLNQQHQQLSSSAAMAFGVAQNKQLPRPVRPTATSGVNANTNNGFMSDDPMNGTTAATAVAQPSLDESISAITDTCTLAEASRNLTQTLRKLSKEVFTNKIDFSPAVSEEVPRKTGSGAVIESMKSHGKGIYSGTFSGTLNPALQDRYGRPKRDISTVIHILNDLLSARPQYGRGTLISVEPPGGSSPPQPNMKNKQFTLKPYPPCLKCLNTVYNSQPLGNIVCGSSKSGNCCVEGLQKERLCTCIFRVIPESGERKRDEMCPKCLVEMENNKTKTKLDQLRLVMQQRKQKREARKLKGAPYSPRPFSPATTCVATSPNNDLALEAGPATVTAATSDTPLLTPTKATLAASGPLTTTGATSATNANNAATASSEVSPNHIVEEVDTAA